MLNAIPLLFSYYWASTSSHFPKLGPILQGSSTEPAQIKMTLKLSFDLKINCKMPQRNLTRNYVQDSPNNMDKPCQRHKDPIPHQLYLMSNVGKSWAVDTLLVNSFSGITNTSNFPSPPHPTTICGMDPLLILSSIFYLQPVLVVMIVSPVAKVQIKTKSFFLMRC